MAELTDSGVLLRMAYRAMLNAGIDADAVLAELGLDPSILNVPDLRTPHDGQEWFWEALAKVSNDEHAAAGVSLLEAAEQAGLKPKHGCRMGICHTCKCRVSKGRVRDLQSGESRELNGQEVRICVHAAEGDVELDL